MKTARRISTFAMLMALLLNFNAAAAPCMQAMDMDEAVHSMSAHSMSIDAAADAATQSHACCNEADIDVQACQMLHCSALSWLLETDLMSRPSLTLRPLYNYRFTLSVSSLEDFPRPPLLA